jgi:hypothetical protein
MKGSDLVRRHVIHNLVLKIISLLIAFGLWYALSIGKLR